MKYLALCATLCSLNALAMDTIDVDGHTVSIINYRKNPIVAGYLTPNGTSKKIPVLGTSSENFQVQCSEQSTTPSVVLAWKHKNAQTGVPVSINADTEIYICPAIAICINGKKTFHEYDAHLFTESGERPIYK